MYSAKINDEPTTFGTSGMLYRSNKVMYDRKTNTLWNQILGEPMLGELVGSGIKLDFFPVALTTWGEWLAERPHTTVMSRDTGYYAPQLYQREDDPRSIYFAYRDDTETMFPVWNRDHRLAPKKLVLGLAVDGVHKAYPIEMLMRERLLDDNVNGVDFTLIGSPLSADALAFRSGGKRFTLPPDAGESLPDTLIDAFGVVWQVQRGALVNTGDASQRLPIHPANVYFWFSWYASHPDTLLYEAHEN